MATNLRETLDRQLQQLQDKVLMMGSRVESGIMEAVTALQQRDLAGARRLIAWDQEINRQRFQIEEEVLTTIALRQPMASDLRVLAALLEVAAELERIGDYAKGIAKVTLRLDGQPLAHPLTAAPEMAERACSMLRRALEAFAARDADAARRIPADDDAVDRLYEQVYREMLACVSADPRLIEQSNLLLWVAHNLERAADRVSNICERVIFTVTGELVELEG